MSGSGPQVLYVTPIFGYPPFGGPRLRTYNTLRALSRCAEVSLYLTQQPDTANREPAREHLLTFCREVVFPPAPPEPTGPRAAMRGTARRMLPARLLTVARDLRAAVHSGQSSGTSGSEKAAPRDPAILAELERWIAAERPDVLWLGFGGISYDLVSLRERIGIPLVLETECVWSRFILREAPFESDPIRQQRILDAGTAKEAEEREGAQRVDVTTAVSEVDAAYFRSLTPQHPERVMLLNNVIDVDAYASSPQQPEALQQPALLFAGTLSHGTANVDAAVWLLDEVMPLVWRQRPDVHVYVVGRSPSPAIVARRSPRAHVTGEVPSIVPYLRGSVAALVPLRWESGTRFKILEAFACSTPVVSTTLGAEGLAVEHGRHLLLADDTESFAGAILALLAEPLLGHRLVGPAFDLVRSEHDVSTAARQIGDVLAQLDVDSNLAVRS
jgi:glycosyltransferase involved in cell wall biosynthesis